MMTRDETASLPPRFVVDSFREAYLTVHGREPAVRYMGNHWYNVNGETVHRATLMQEIISLREAVAQRPPPPPPRSDKNVINRLIARLRGL
jgi:hypothetical protein